MKIKTLRFSVEDEATRMSVDIQPPTPIEFATSDTGGHDHDHEHLDVLGDHSSVYSLSSSHSHHSAMAPGAGTASPSLSRSPSPSVSKAYNTPPATVERSGLCVICQDEEVSLHCNSRLITKS
jgi:hypothetical protein